MRTILSQEILSSPKTLKIRGNEYVLYNAGLQRGQYNALCDSAEVLDRIAKHVKEGAPELSRSIQDYANQFRQRAERAQVEAAMQLARLDESPVPWVKRWQMWLVVAFVLAMGGSLSFL